MMNFTEAEKQVLIALIELSKPIETSNNSSYEFFPDTLEKATRYFRNYLEDWGKAYESLLKKGLVLKNGDRFCLTNDGDNIAMQIREKYPPIYYWYREFYSVTKDSKAYAKFCEAVYSKNFSQHGFSNIRQLQKLLEVAGIEKKDIVLDLGCGNGLMAEYISDLTEAHVYGIDYIPEAIKQAQDRTVDKRHRLTFEEGCIGEKQFPSGFFNVIISIDSIFFGRNMVETLTQLKESLKPKGQMLIFYPEFRFDSNKSLEILKANNTELAKALDKCNLKYETWDFTLEHYKFMRLKHHVAQDLKSEFEAEGNQFLYKNLNDESIDDLMTFDSFKDFSTRYLYHIRL